MIKHMSSLMKNQTQILVVKSLKARLVGSKWAFKKKEGILSVKASRHKARVVDETRLTSS